MSSYKVEDQADEEPRASHKEDPLVKIAMNPQIMSIAATLIAKLEHVKYEETRRGVFRTAWAKDLFNTCVKRMSKNASVRFDIDEWYRETLDALSGTSQGTRYDISPTKYTQCVDNNWLIPLFDAEVRSPGFMMLLHNVLDMEDKTHSQLAERAKSEVEYDFLNLGMRNPSISRPSLEGPKKKKTPVPLLENK